VNDFHGTLGRMLICHLREGHFAETFVIMKNYFLFLTNVACSCVLNLNIV